MKAALDVSYSAGCAHAACVVFDSWFDDNAIEISRASVPGVRPYLSGRFFERELEPLLAVLDRSGDRFSHIVIDGYVHLEGGEMGLGAHLHDALSYPAAVVGVAKSPLALAAQFAPIRRGRSSRPLYVSTVGWSLDEAVAAVLGMHGSFRIPTLLRAADRVARGVHQLPGIDTPE